MNGEPVIIIGAGVAGLACALRLAEAQVSCLVLEAGDAPGGRVRTDTVDGFRLDRGFQVLLTAYPEARTLLDYRALDLRPFLPGALVRRDGRFEEISDPVRRPSALFRTLRAGVGSFGDKLRILRLRRHVSRHGTNGWAGLTTEAALREFGFSERMIEGFFRPWFGGVFLDRSLSTPASQFAYHFRAFAAGPAALPADGMGAIPGQLAARLPEGALRLRTRAVEVRPDRVRLDSGESLPARAVVVATEAPAAARLLGHAPPPPGRGVTCTYFAAPRPPLAEPLLVLDGEGRGPVTNFCVPSAVAPSYAPAGEALVSATVLGRPQDDEQTLLASTRSQLRGWFGEQVDSWRHLRSYRIAHGLPAGGTGDGRLRVAPGIYQCGDHVGGASLDGAMRSGREAAEAVLAEARP